MRWEVIVEQGLSIIYSKGYRICRTIRPVLIAVRPDKFDGGQ